MSLEGHSSKVRVSSVQADTKCHRHCFLHNCLPDRRLHTSHYVVSGAWPSMQERSCCLQADKKGHSVRWNCAPRTDIKFRVIPSKRTLVYAVTAQPSAFHVFVKRWLRRLLGQQDTACCLKVILCSRLLSCRQWLKIVRNFRKLAP
jgi:hypothetical protein